MRSLGKLVGRSRSGSLIVRSEAPPSLGETVVDKDLVVLGRVVDVFGPASTPYATIREQGRSSISPGKKVYVLTRKDGRMHRWRSPRD
jgi:rRNA processing protein Gar1